MNADFYLVERDTPEWDRMWAWLGDHVWNCDYPHPTVCENENEVWQYMGTEIRPNSAGHGGGSAMCHTFRHRAHPRFAGERRYLACPVLEADKSVL